MKTLLILAALCISLSTASAELTASHKAAVEKLIVESQMDQQITASFVESIEATLNANGDQVKALPKEQQQKFAAAVAKVKASMAELTSWEKVKPMAIEIYAKHFSEIEATEVIALLQTPAGKLYVKKQTAMVHDFAGVTVKLMSDVTPQIMKIIQSEMQN